MISRKTVKSKASRVHPSQAAHQAYHWSLVGSFHQGMLFTVSTAAMLSPSRSRRLLRWSPSSNVKQGCEDVAGVFQPRLGPCGVERPKRGVSSNRQVGYQKLSFCLRAHQPG